MGHDAEPVSVQNGDRGPADGRRRLVDAVDYSGTFVFAVEGGLAGVAAHLDLFGVAMVALLTATGGGMVRDVLMGDTPPRALRTTRYLLLGIGGGLVAFVFHDLVTRNLEDVVVVLDAVGLSLFAVTGAALATTAGMNRLTAVLLGTITAVGGGTLRDVVLNQVPEVLQANIYAVAAAAGATAYVAMVHVRRRPSEAMLVGAVVCFLVRMCSVWLDWQLPVA